MPVRTKYFGFAQTTTINQTIPIFTVPTGMTAVVKECGGLIGTTAGPVKAVFQLRHPALTPTFVVASELVESGSQWSERGTWLVVPEGWSFCGRLLATTADPAGKVVAATYWAMGALLTGLPPATA